MVFVRLVERRAWCPLKLPRGELRASVSRAGLRVGSTEPILG